MQAFAKSTIKQSAKKVRFVLDEVRNLYVEDALSKLRFINKKAAKILVYQGVFAKSFFFALALVKKL